MLSLRNLVSEREGENQLSLEAAAMFLARFSASENLLHLTAISINPLHSLHDTKTKIMQNGFPPPQFPEQRQKVYQGLSPIKVFIIHLLLRDTVTLLH